MAARLSIRRSQLPDVFSHEELNVKRLLVMPGVEVTEFAGFGGRTGDAAWVPVVDIDEIAAKPDHDLRLGAQRYEADRVYFELLGKYL